jgi:hypothetical protein
MPNAANTLAQFASVPPLPAYVMVGASQIAPTAPHVASQLAAGAPRYQQKPPTAVPPFGHGVGVPVGDGVGVSFGVFVAVLVSVTVAVGLFVAVTVGETVAVRVAVLVGVAVARCGLWSTAGDGAG